MSYRTATITVVTTSDPWLYHFTHVDNLPGIIAEGLLSDSQAGDACVQEAGNPSIKERRRDRPVPLPPGGVVADYVPFYFAPRSPMLSSIVNGQVHEYRSDQTHLIYLLTRMSTIIGRGLPWIATDRNAVLATAKFADHLDQLSTHIDWEVIEAKYWANTASDGSRRERRMAELIIHQTVPWEAFTHLAVCCETRKTEVEGMLSTSSHVPAVVVRDGWYFDVPRSCACKASLERSAPRDCRT